MILNASPKIVKKVKKELNITFYLKRDLVAKYITIKKILHVIPLNIKFFNRR